MDREKRTTIISCVAILSFALLLGSMVLSYHYTLRTSFINGYEERPDLGSSATYWRKAK